MLWLALFNDAEHYQSVRRKGDRERGPAEVEDRLALPHEKDKSESARIARGELPAPAAESSKSGSSGVSMVFASLPVGHAFTPDYVTGVLSRVKGDVGAAVEILIEEVDTLSEISDDADSDGKVEQMLIDDSQDGTYTPDPNTEYREKAVTPPIPPRSTSPSTSSIDSVGHTSESDASHSSIATTPSSGSIRSTRSKRSTSGGSKHTTKPYQRPTQIGTRRKGKELSKELEELKMGASIGLGDGKVETARRKSIEAQGERRKSQLDELKAAREKQKAKV